MPDFVTLTCPSCGGQLQITSDMERFACAHCGKEHLVRRGSGVVSLAPVVEGIQRVQTGVDKTASELAIKRLLMEIQALQAARQGTVTSGANFGWGPYVLAMAMGFPLFFAGLCSASNSGALGWILMILGIGVVVGGLAIGMKQQMETKKPYLAAIDQQIVEKTEELRKHHDLVSS